MNGLRYLEAAVAALAALWLAAGLLAHPAAFGALALLALLPLALVVVPVLVSLAFAERSATVRWSGRPKRPRDDGTARTRLRTGPEGDDRSHPAD